MIKLKDLLKEDVGQLTFPRLLNHNSNPESNVKRIHEPSGKEIRHPKTGKKITNISKDVAKKSLQNRGFSSADIGKKTTGGISYPSAEFEYDDGDIKKFNPIAFAKRNDYVIQHEAFHNTMNLIHDKYGDDVYKAILDDLIEFYPKSVLKALTHLLSLRGYKRKDTSDKYIEHTFKEEIVNITRDILSGGTGNRPDDIRKPNQKASKAYIDLSKALKDIGSFNTTSFEKTMTWYMSQLKDIWKKMLQYSKNVELEDL